MGLGYTPMVRVRGAHAELINTRLLTWELIDAAGRQSDQLTLRVDTQGIDGLPKEGETIGLEVGYAEEESLTDKGDFKITRVTPRIYPDSVTIVATAAPFQVKDETEFKKRRSRSFEKITLGDLFRQVITTHGYSPRVAPDLDAIMLEHVDQSDETDMSFLTRLAKRYDAVTKPVDQLYVLARRGQVKSLSGQSLTPVRYSLPTKNVPTAASFINAEADFPSRTIFKGVVTTYWDPAQGKELEVKVGEAPFKKLRNQHDSQEQANEAANGEMRKLARTGVKIRMDVPGDPRLVAEGLLELDDSFPDYMRGRWSLDRVISRGNRGQGYRCSLEATEPL
ncbi:MAG: phage late control D family protein [Rikenellaceae bacterium]